ncbi:DUF4926 domain-containing protein [Persicitalea sp.]|uniref:DUF4926 domain-containing protein n=1 Tax=Persicitalea sp. TaxID=3100273 RepID=UPI0035948D55
MHKDLDLVALLNDRPEHTLHRGDVGTVVHVYEATPTDSSGLYEVEFMNAAGDTVAVVTLREDEVKAVELQNVMLHLSDRAA